MTNEQQEIDTRILKVLQLLRAAIPNAITVFSEGSCVLLAIMLSEAFPGGQVLYDGNHAIFEHSGKCYDITGQVKKEGHLNIMDYGISMLYDLLQQKHSDV